jgi:hypothetical protein
MMRVSVKIRAIPYFRGIASSVPFAWMNGGSPLRRNHGAVHIRVADGTILVLAHISSAP